MPTTGSSLSPRRDGLSASKRLPRGAGCGCVLHPDHGKAQTAPDEEGEGASPKPRPDRIRPSLCQPEARASRRGGGGCGTLRASPGVATPMPHDCHPSDRQHRQPPHPIRVVRLLFHGAVARRILGAQDSFRRLRRRRCPEAKCLLGFHSQRDDAHRRRTAANAGGNPAALPPGCRGLERGRDEVPLRCGIWDLGADGRLREPFIMPRRRCKLHLIWRVAPRSFPVSTGFGG